MNNFADKQFTFLGRNVFENFFWDYVDSLTYELNNWDLRQKPLFLDPKARKRIGVQNTGRLSLNHHMKKVNNCRISLLRDNFHRELLERGIDERYVKVLILSDPNWACLYSRSTKYDLDYYSPTAHFMDILSLQLELLFLYYKLEWMELLDPCRTYYTSDRKLVILSIVQKRYEISAEEKLYQKNLLKLPDKRGKIEKEKLLEILTNIERVYNFIFLNVPLEQQKQNEDPSYNKEFLRQFEESNGSFDRYKDFLRHVEETHDGFNHFQKITESFIKGDHSSDGLYKDGIGSFIDCIVKKYFLYFMEPILQDTFPNDPLGDKFNIL